MTMTTAFIYRELLRQKEERKNKKRIIKEQRGHKEVKR